MYICVISDGAICLKGFQNRCVLENGSRKLPLQFKSVKILRVIEPVYNKISPGSLLPFSIFSISFNSFFPIHPEFKSTL